MMFRKDFIEVVAWAVVNPMPKRRCPRLPQMSHTGVMDYDEACFMHLIPGVAKKYPRFLFAREGGNP